jgi:hypothetical protein
MNHFVPMPLALSFLAFGCGGVVAWPADRYPMRRHHHPWERLNTTIKQETARIASSPSVSYRPFGMSRDGEETAIFFALGK